jgi:alanyl-tRNA synthetase
MPRPPIRTANDLRNAWTSFFADKGHSVVPSASLIPHDPTVLFTVAGMVPFKSYFTGDEASPYRRAASVQKCARAGGKHNDLDDVGRTKRHLVFFEMLGNFSFGDYFKAEAIPWSWELVTEVFGFDGDRIWVTVHTSDDEAEQIWHEVVGVPMDRIQRLGDKDNFWQMGDTGPCGPCTELHIDRGPAFGPEGGPLHDPHGDRYMEFWNLVFMQFNQAPDGSRTPLPKPSIDTGAGLERILTLIQGEDAVWDTDLMRPLIEQASSLTGKRYIVGDYEDRNSFGLRVLAEHARSGAMLVNDGVLPSNENRGYVLRRILRRAIRFAYLLGADRLVMPSLAGTAVDVMADAYPDLRKNRDFILNVITREEEAFRRTLRNGLSILDKELADGATTISGATAFMLHDTYGFPLEVTTEVTAERGVEVDRAGFDTEMERQRERAKSARRAGAQGEGRLEDYRSVMEQFGTTEFLGYSEDTCEARVLAVLPLADDGEVEVFLDRTPFYAESGGQMGDTGTISTETGTVAVSDTSFAIPGLRRHSGRIVSGFIDAGQVAQAQIDNERRAAIRRNHTGTHVLHWALREVLGDHVKQQGSLVAPDRLRFDFSHFQAVSADEIEQIERLANAEVLANEPVRAYETTKDEAAAMGAIAFFGDKYGDIVRVLEAGRNSMELCGGTHVRATGDIGTIKIVSEGSIASGVRRIEAVTGAHSVVLLQQESRALADAARLVGTRTDELVVGIQRKLDEIKALQDELKQLRASAAVGRANELVGSAVDGVLVSRVDGLAQADLRDLAVAVRQAGVGIVVLIGETDSGGVALTAAVTKESGLNAGDLVKDAARAVGGGGGGRGDIAVAGGKDPTGIDAALDAARAAVQSLRSR